MNTQTKLEAKFPDTEDFIIRNLLEQGKQYIKAMKENRLFCILKGENNFAFFSTEKKGGKFYISNYNLLFSKIGYKTSYSRSDYFTQNNLSILSVNYDMIEYLRALGFVSKAKAKELQYKTVTIL